MKKFDIQEKLVYENQFLEKGYSLIAGCDEVGRGCLAGAVVCACVIMPNDSYIDGVDDSKKLSAKKREELNKLILEKAIAYSIIEIDNTIIDGINILNATKLCMQQAIESMSITPDIVLIDALDIKTNVKCFPIIKGDALSYTIGCASIIAKVYRDNVMKEYDKQFPQYKLASNKGYGTTAHIDALKEFGSCEIHRQTFIKKLLTNS